MPTDNPRIEEVAYVLSTEVPLTLESNLTRVATLALRAADEADPERLTVAECRALHDEALIDDGIQYGISATDESAFATAIRKLRRRLERGES